MIILGIDPGSRHTGYGLIHLDLQRNQSKYITSGCIHLKESSLQLRLPKIYLELRSIVELYKPQEAAIEKIFMHASPESALKLGHARGAAIVAVNVPLLEYSARQVKLSVVGHGAAKKEQVQFMVTRLLKIEHKLQSDEADALAIALCHAHSKHPLRQSVQGSSNRKLSWRNYSPLPK